MPDPNKPNNLKTALILASLALAFFIGLFVKRFWFS
ncbi:cytochrome oxidase small assembly protein [Noviherbaspirillum sp.]